MCCPRAADSGRRHGSRLPVAACVPTSQEKAVSGHCGRHEVGVVGAAVRARRLNVAQAHSPRIAGPPLSDSNRSDDEIPIESHQCT